MAYKIMLNNRFVERAENLAQWLEKEWSKKVADDFVNKLNATILNISKNPFIGSPSETRKNIRKLKVTIHNKIYYRVTGNKITFIKLFDTRQNPKKDKYK